MFHVEQWMSAGEINENSKSVIRNKLNVPCETMAMSVSVGEINENSKPDIRKKIECST